MSWEAVHVVLVVTSPGGEEGLDGTGGGWGGFYFDPCKRIARAGSVNSSCGFSELHFMKRRRNLCASASQQDLSHKYFRSFELGFV